MDSGWLGIPRVVLALAVLVAWYNVVRLRRARSAMLSWIDVQGYTLSSARLCWLPIGPFGWYIACHQPVYRVVARDRAGVSCRGWIRCVPFSDRVDARWEARG